VKRFPLNCHIKLIVQKDVPYYCEVTCAACTLSCAPKEQNIPVLKEQTSPGLVVHPSNPSTEEAKGRGS
jgi:hypothetical protein